MNNILIGVIVPVYKTEKYVAECIESILAQTYTNFRLILVDDGSPDNAGAICDEYATKDSRITVIHQENAGVTRARARGVEEAHDCEWITFVDSDDTIRKDALYVLLSSTENNNCDIVVSHINSSLKSQKTNYITTNEYIYRIIIEELCSPWGKLFRRFLFGSKTFNTPSSIVIGEDLIMNLHLAFMTNKCVCIIYDKIYSYKHHEDSTINAFHYTLEYETILYNHITEVIAQYSTNMHEFAHALIKRRLLWWDRLFGYKDATPAWHGTEYHCQLLNDIQRYKYPLNIIEKKLLKESRPCFRKVLIFIRKIVNTIRY